MRKQLVQLQIVAWGKEADNVLEKLTREGARLVLMLESPPESYISESTII